MSGRISQEQAFRRARALARRTCEPAYVVFDCDEYHAASEADLDTFFLGARVVAEVLCDGTCVPAYD